MSASLPADFLSNIKINETITNEEPIHAFILTKEYSPRDSQDDKILSQTLQNYPKF